MSDRMSVTINPTQALGYGTIYKELTKTKDNTHLTHPVRQAARFEIIRLLDTRYDVMYECMLCLETKVMLSNMSVAEFATWEDIPRGICEECDGRTTVTVLATDNPPEGVR